MDPKLSLSTAETSYPTPSSDSSPPESLTVKLERLSAVVVKSLNARDFDFVSEEGQELVSHIAADFRAELDSLPNQMKPRTFEEQKIAWKKRVLDFPDVHFEIIRMDSQVQEKKNHASVYMDMKVTGLGEDVVLHAMNQLEWRKTAGDWFCYHAIGMRGSMANAGAVG